MEQKMTLEEVLTMCIQTLSNISVPVAFAESVSAPIVNVVKNLQACVSFIQTEEAKKGENDEREADPE